MIIWEVAFNFSLFCLILVEFRATIFRAREKKFTFHPQCAPFWSEIQWGRPENNHTPHNRRRILFTLNIKLLLSPVFPSSKFSTQFSSLTLAQFSHFSEKGEDMSKKSAWLFFLFFTTKKMCIISAL